jgi:hypothetical protein
LIKISLAKSTEENEDSNSQNMKKIINNENRKNSIDNKGENTNNNDNSNLTKKQMSIKNLTPSFLPSIEALKKKRIQKISK